MNRVRSSVRTTYADLGLDAGDRIGRIDVERDGRAREGLEEYLPVSVARDREVEGEKEELVEN